VSNILFAWGGLFLLAAMAYAAYALLNTWLMGQDRFLRSDEIASISVPVMTWTPSPTPVLSEAEGPTPPPPPVQVRIPALGVARSIIPLPRVRDRSGFWTWDTDRLFRAGRSDLVGHWQGSAYPGEMGNVVLVGHNYGYGYNGVFVALGRLKAGQKVYVVNQAGETFTYQVKTVKRVKWRRKDFAELTQHLSFLAPGGAERLTLVSCAGADFEPFPERVYVVAEPVR
jgi:LPXTG-site transpeptidase (sortase) family protein